MSGPLNLTGCPRGRIHRPRGRTRHLARRPVAHGELGHEVRKQRVVRQCHADGQGNLPDALPERHCLPGRDLHRKHAGRAVPKLLRAPAWPQASPHPAGSITSCAFPPHLANDNQCRARCARDTGRFWVVRGRHLHEVPLTSQHGTCGAIASRLLKASTAKEKKAEKHLSQVLW